MSIIDDNLKKLNITLPDPKGPVGAYVATKIVGKLLFISGQVSIDEEGNLIKRTIRDLLSSDVNEVIIEGKEGYETAKKYAKIIIPSQTKKIK